MNPNPLIVAATVLMIAILAVWIGTTEGPRSQKATGDLPQIAKVLKRQPSDNSSIKRQAVTGKPTVGTADDLTGLTVTTPESARQLSCLKLEADARRQLANLTASLGLSSTQRERVFFILVRGADDYHPSMLVGGTTAGEPVESINDAICEELRPAQEATFQEALLDDAAWWNDTIAQLEASITKTNPNSFDVPLTEIK